MKRYLTIAWTLHLAAWVVALAVVPTLAVTATAKDKSLSKSELRTLVLNAQTPADHERIAEYYDSQATKYETEAKKHQEEATYYSSHVQPPIGKNQGFYSREMENHCPKMAAKLTEAAQEARMLADGHRELAKQAK